MKLIATGLQYKVYDLDNGRVLKKATTFKEKSSLLMAWNIGNANYTQKDAERDARSAETETAYSISNLKRRVDGVDLGLLGNPLFFDDFNYEQDKVMMVTDYLLIHSLVENKSIIDEYIRCVFNTWKFGFSEKVFNFTINSGVNQAGQVILCDLGELLFSKQRVRELIRAKSWFQSWSFQTLPDPKLKEYYKKQTTSNLTLANLNLNWLPKV